MATGGKKKGRGKNGTPSTAASDAADLLDMVGMFAASLERAHDDETLDQAQEIAFDAWEATTPRKRVALAEKALAISPRCADAYSILAEEAATPEEAIALYRRAVAAGAEVLGERAFKEDVGHFWGLIETRPYMRASQGLAFALWRNGARDEAIAIYRDLLRLNPTDNQGVRYVLMDALLELGRDAEASKLWTRYRQDDSAAWVWSKALMTFRIAGDNDAARKALAAAVAANTHVPAYLTGRKRLPRSLPEFVGMGDADEAVAYVHDAGPVWAATQGAVAWVQACLTSEAPPPTAPEHREVPISEERIDEAVLALLLLGLHAGNRAWKTFDWDAMDRLHAKGLISDPAGRAKSVVLTEEGVNAARLAFEVLFAETPGL